VTLDPDNIAEFASQEGIAADSPGELVTHPRIVKLVDSEVAKINAKLPSFEGIKKVTIVDEFTIENGLLTPTLKLKKNIAMDRYKNKIDAMYPDD
jgi:long-chain acyl-CoA synthetase